MGTGGGSIRLLFAAAALFESNQAAALEEPQGAAPSEAANQSTGPLNAAREIVVLGRLDDGSIEGVAPRDELDEDDIDAFGADSVGEIIEELSASVGRSGEGPVVLINGELASGVDDISDLPPEALKRIQLLPPSAAVRYGAPRSRPVINVVIKRRFRQATAIVQAVTATAGEGNSGNGELRWTAIKGPSRNNISLKLEGNDPLYEEERAIRDQPEQFPLSFTGIVLPQPLFGSEIDPALSALAGKTVSVADVPSGAGTPTLSAFAANAGRATPGDLGRYRSLINRSRRVSLNGTFARRLSKRLTAQFYLRADFSTTMSYNGATQAFLSLPASSPFSPFTTGVTVARYLGDPLEQAQRSGNFDVGGTLNRVAGAWRMTLGGNWSHGESRSRTQRGLDITALQNDVSAGTIDPFNALPRDLLTAQVVDRASRTRDRQSAQFNATGPLFALPAGRVTANINGSATRERSFTSSELRGVPSERRTARDEGLIRGGLEVPLLASGEGGDSAIGDLSVSISGSARSISRAGTYKGYGYGFEWRPVEALTIEGGYDRVQVPPNQQVLTDPIIVRDNIRVFDFITGQNVDVRYLTGGNPGLATERRGLWSLGARLALVPRGGFDITANWTRQKSKDVQSSLPPPSADVQVAFPDRYRSDVTGRLVEVDGRPVSFARVEREDLTWGFSLRRRIGTGPKTLATAEASTDEDDDAPAPQVNQNTLRNLADGVRVSASLQHIWTLSSLRQARVGLPVVDLLAGGAAGYGGGQARHRIEFRTGVSAGGFGAQLSGNWTAATEIRGAHAVRPSDLLFSSQTRVNLRLFADLGRFVGPQSALRGARVSFEVNNLTDSQTRVKDRTGVTPVSYQRYLLDPLGRTVSVSLRKKF